MASYWVKQKMTKLTDWYTDARYGLFVHYGLFSLLERGEWVMNRERISPTEYAKLADRFIADQFDADAICDLAVRAGMRYIVFTTMHHDGFRLYDSDLSPFNSVRVCGRDLTAEIIAAARKRGLEDRSVPLTLNNWSATPDIVRHLWSVETRIMRLSLRHSLESGNS